MYAAIDREQVGYHARCTRMHHWSCGLLLFTLEPVRHTRIGRNAGGLLRFRPAASQHASPAAAAGSPARCLTLEGVADKHHSRGALPGAHGRSKWPAMV